jgi:predicted small metal-binding protein
MVLSVPHISSEDTTMKELHCKDVGFECKGVLRAQNEEELLKQAADHARTAHGVQQLDAATIATIRTKVRTV